VTDDADNEPPKKRTKQQAPQLRLALADPSAPPFDRSQCPVERPCTRFACEHHNWRVDERAGKPNNGKPAPPKLLPMVDRATVPSCSLDVSESPHGRDDDGVMSTEALARNLGYDERRTLQVEARALVKQRIAHMLEDVLDEELRSKLPDGTLVTIYPENRTDTAHVFITLAFRVDTPGVKGATIVNASGGGVRIRRKT
jgi:hypothetical protein